MSESHGTDQTARCEDLHVRIVQRHILSLAFRFDNRNYAGDYGWRAVLYVHGAFPQTAIPEVPCDGNDIYVDNNNISGGLHTAFGSKQAANSDNS